MDPAPAASERSHAEPVRLSYRSIARFVAVLALALAARNVIGRSLVVLLWALRCAVVAGAVRPLVTLLRRRLSKGLAVLVTLLVIVAAVGGLAYTVVGDVRAEQARLTRVLPEAARRLQGSPRFGRAATDFQLADRVEDLLDALPQRIAGGTGTAAVRRTATRGATLLVNIVLSIFLVVYGSRLVNGALAQVPDDGRRHRARGVAQRAYRRAWRYVVGRFAIAALGGVVAYLGCRVADVPGPTVLALVVAIVGIVPYVGCIVGGLPIVLLAFGLHPTGRAGTALVLLLVAFQVVDSIVFLRPLHRRSIVFGPALTLLVAMIGFALGGIGLAISGWAAAVFLAAVADELTPDHADPAGGTSASFAT